MIKFWYHPESDCYLAAEKQPDPLCNEITFQEYCAAMHPNLYGYDIETYPNVFTVTIQRPSDVALWRFEISQRVNQGVEFFQLLTAIKASDGRMVGFNNNGFDYPVIHELITKGGHITAYELYLKCDEIINGNDRFGSMVWESDWYVPQIDLFKIHHFDNKARSTSLKMLEFNMRSENIQDLPFPPGTELTNEQIDELIPYNDHDVFETVKFLSETIPMLEFRDELSVKYGRNFTNYNDGKIGSDYFITELERLGIPCYHRPNGKREPRQTPRPVIDLNTVILPWIQFERPEFQRVLNWLRAQTITETKGVFKELSATINGFQYDFGTGGIHGSVEAQIVSSDNEFALIDIDVKSFYPNLAIANRFYPEHLGEQFCDIYQDVYNQRISFTKGTMQNAALKYALNVPYGQSNSKYSPLYDPAYTMAITINGQLLLCLLAEWLLTIPQLTMIQVNTDGLTVRVPRIQADSVMFIAQCWEQQTGLELERADYSRMMIRDVNSYIGEYEKGGKLKRKGAYGYGDDLGWHQNHGSRIVAIAAEAALVHGVPIAETVNNHTDMMDFMKRTKVPRSSRLMLEFAGGAASQQQQNITRYYVADGGGSLMKIMPPTPAQVKKDPAAPERRIGIDVGWTVTPCNDLGATPMTGEFAKNRYFYDLNHDYYITQAEKLVNPLIQGCNK